MRTVQEALTSCYRQSQAGPAFAPGMCKAQTRAAYGVPSDGSGSATAAWYRTDHRVQITPTAAPRGALLWWTGGSEGYGHVAIADGQGNVWSVDVKRPGYWDLVPYAAIRAWAPRLLFAGVSLDIDGVQVVPSPVVKPPPPSGTIQGLRLSRLARMLNEDRVVDLNLIDEIIKHGTPAQLTAAAIAAKWAIINATRAILKAGGR